MLHRMIFYGSLMNIDLFHKVTGFRPDTVRHGFIHGDLYAVTDYTEPRAIFNYPILVLSDSKNIVVSVEIKLCLDNKQTKRLWRSLNSFEGDLYKTARVMFHPFHGKPVAGIVYTAKANCLLGKTNIVKLNPISTVYVWNP